MFTLAPRQSHRHRGWMSIRCSSHFHSPSVSLGQILTDRYGAPNTFCTSLAAFAFFVGRFGRTVTSSFSSPARTMNRARRRRVQRPALVFFASATATIACPFAFIHSSNLSKDEVAGSATFDSAITVGLGFQALQFTLSKTE